jgi:hypothetical protein
MKIVSQPITTPTIDWDTVFSRWISLRDVGLNGGFVFDNPYVKVESLFAETYDDPDMPHFVALTDGRLGVMSGEVVVLRAILAGKNGLEAKVYRL